MPRLFDIRINTSERERKMLYRVIVYPTRFTGREAPYYDYLGEDGYELACDEFGWIDTERAAIHCELMANGGWFTSCGALSTEQSPKTSVGRLLTEQSVGNRRTTPPS